MNPDALPCSTIAPPEAMVDPEKWIARKLEQDVMDIKVVSTETMADGNVKIRFYLLRS